MGYGHLGFSLLKEMAPKSVLSLSETLHTWKYSNLWRRAFYKNAPSCLHRGIFHGRRDQIKQF